MSKKIKVLVADDHVLVRKGICFLLERLPKINVHEARNRAEAIIKAKTLHPDIILMDIAWYQCNGLGININSQIRGLEPQPCVLALNLHNNKECLQAAKHFGARGYLHKESGVMELLKAIHTVKSGNRYFSTESAWKTNEKAGQSTQEDDVLTPRQKEVLKLLAMGETIRSSAEILRISEKTIEVHRSNFSHKLGLHTIAELTLYAVRNGIVSID